MGGFSYAGGGAQDNLLLSSPQTPDALLLTTNVLSNGIVLCEAADATFDFAHGLATDPTLFIHSHNQSTTQWLGLTHQGTFADVTTGTGGIRFSGAGTALLYVNPSGTLVEAPSSGYFCWGSTTDPTAGADLFLGREGAGILQMGQDVNGAPVTQVVKAHDGITGTDVKGAELDLKPGLGTGAGVSGPIAMFRPITKATGTSAQTYGQGLVVAPTKLLSTASASAQTVATINTTTLTGGGVLFYYTVVGASATAVDTDTGCIHISWNNPAGTVAATAGTIINSVQSNSSGTLAATPTVTVATNVVSIKLTPTWATIVPTSVVYYGFFLVGSPDSLVVL